MPSTRVLRFTIIACLATLLSCQATSAWELKFKAVPIEPRGRIDALAYLGKGVVLAGTRNGHPDYLHRSKDYGATWHEVGDIDVRVVVGGTNKGYILYARIPGE